MMVAFCVDSGIRTGSGHVMRCLALSKALGSRNVDIVWLLRPGPGSMIDDVRAAGFRVLPVPNWEDAANILPPVDWIVIDHYGLGATWENGIQQSTTARIAVVDDLANRAHCCDMIVDHNPGRTTQDYTTLVPRNATCLIGPEYALLRSQFAAAREASVSDRQDRPVHRILVSFGGTDPDDVTSKVLNGLSNVGGIQNLAVRVVLGPHAPHRDRVEALLSRWTGDISLVVGQMDMASEIARADIAIGAAGGSALERCALGLPTLIIAIAPNQELSARALVGAGAAWALDSNDIETGLAEGFNRLSQHEALSNMQWAASQVTDGLGAERLATWIVSYDG